jgi:hypothetical protein
MPRLLVIPALSLALIHRSAWNRNSQKSISRNLHGLPRWKRMMAYFAP